MGALRYTWRDAVRGVLIYGAGDSAAALISGELSLTRAVGMMAVGGTLYALEIPSWFAWIDRRVPEGGDLRARLGRTGLALLYFNPLWIARHLLLIKLFALDWQAIEPGLLAPVIGNTYAGAALIGLSAVLDIAEPDDHILLVSFGSGAGSDAFDIQITDAITGRRDRAPKTQDYIARRTEIDYATYTRMRNKLVMK